MIGADDEVAVAYWRRWLETENLALGLTLGYVFLSFIGMLHRALVFLQFRINIFDYAEPSDFILSALRDPLIILVSLAPIPIFAVYFRWSYAMSAKSKMPKWLGNTDVQREKMKRLRRPMYIATTMLWALAASMHYASSVARNLRAGDGQRMRVELVNDAAHAASDTTSWLLLGTTHSYLFFYDPVKQVTSIIPANNVARVAVSRKKAGK